jgi:hypothetical protein
MDSIRNDTNILTSYALISSTETSRAVNPGTGRLDTALLAKGRTNVRKLLRPVKILFTWEDMEVFEDGTSVGIGIGVLWEFIGGDGDSI